MKGAQHVFRRGAVYWWRRQLPCGPRSHGRFVVAISLRTKALDVARAIAADVTQASEALKPELSRAMISPEDARRILARVAIAQAARLDRLAAAEVAYGEAAESGRQMDVATGWAYRLFAAQGPLASIGEPEVLAMGKAGLDEETIKLVGQTMVTLKDGGAIPPSRFQIESLMAEFGIPATRVNAQQTEQLYLRGMAAALLDTKRRWSGIRDDDDVLLQTALSEEAQQPIQSQTSPALSFQPEVSPTPGLLGEPLRPEPRTEPAPAQEVVAAPAVLEASPDEIEEVDFDEPESEDENASYTGLVEIVSTGGAAKVRLGEWTEKTLTQHIQLAKLFVRFLEHDDARRMQQGDLARFRDLFLSLPKTYGKSPRDHVVPLSDILARAAKLPKDQVGLSAATINRHMTHMTNIVNMSKTYGYSWESFEGVSGLRARKRNTDESKRPKFATEELETLLRLPVWTGARSEADWLESGETVVHCARYWVPLVAAYQGARREEICGLQLDDIDEIEGMPRIRIAKSVIRNLKTSASTRAIPIHPELIRLGFLDYVETLRQAGHHLLFPELRAVVESTPMGDVFDYEWQIMRDQALPKAKEEGKVFHSFRHWCNNEMKQAGVPSEIRKDILGHSNRDVNEGTYSDAARLRLMRDALLKLPAPSLHLERTGICLLSQVISHQPRQGRQRQTGRE